MKQLKIAIGGFLALTLLVSCGDFGKLADIGEIAQKYEAGNIEEAKVEMEAYLATNADNDYAWTIMGHIYNDLAQDSLSKDSYKKALQINPERVQALTGLGILARLEGDYVKATRYYERAISLDSEYAPAYSSLVAIYLKRRDFSKAVEYGEKGYKYDKEDPVIAANLSVAYHYAGDTLNRDKFYQIAKDKNYGSIDTLLEIFNGELTILDD
ncbi:MAG: tetratricopeptide repeat protein [Flavobacteriaceae bacterium]|nr:tetratricopeptide repeat protein [Flavobacteriaceae bacterium]